MTRKLFMLLQLIQLAFAQQTTTANFWLGQYFGQPSQVHFLSKSKAILVDPKAFALLDIETGNLEFITPERIFNSGLINNQLLIFNKEQRKVYFFNPLTGALISDKRLKDLEIANVIVKDNAIYYVYKNLIVREKQEEEIRLDFEGKEIVKVVFADEPTGRILVLVEEEKKREVCVFNVEANLHKMERKNCFLLENKIEGSEKILDAFFCSAEIVLVFENFLYSQNEGKIFFSHFSGKSVGNFYTDNFDCFAKNGNLKIKESAFSKCLRQKNNCVQNQNSAHSSQVKQLCHIESSDTTVKAEISSGLSVELRHEMLSERASQFFADVNSNSIFVYTKKDSLLAFDLRTGKLLWARDEGLANIADVIFLQNAQEDEIRGFVDEYDKLLKNRKYFSAWKVRMSHSLREFFDLFGNIKNKLTSLTGSYFAAITSNLARELKEGKQEELINFKTSKTALFISQSGKIFAFDLERQEFTKTLLLKHKVVAHSKEKELPVEKNQQAKVCELHKSDSFHILVSCGKEKADTFLLDGRLNQFQKKQAEIFPVSAKTEAKYSFSFSANQNILAGFYKDSQIWDIRFPAGHSLVALQRIQDLRIPRFAHVIDNKNVLYKVVDPNNALLVLKGQTGFVFIVVNLKFGKVIFEATNQKVSSAHKLNLLADDGSFFISYFNSESLQSELLHIEVFRKRVENDFWEIIRRSFSSREPVLKEIDYSQSSPEFLIAQKTYALPFAVKKIRAFDSKSDLTSKNLVVLTESDQVYSLPRSLVSTRRIFESEKAKVEDQLAKPNKAKIPAALYLKSLSLAFYDFYLPLDPKKFLSKNQSVSAAEAIWIEPTNFESTSVVVCSGKSLFMAVHAPDNKFDQLPEDFSKAKLWGLFVLFVLAIVLTNKMAEKKRPMEKYLAGKAN